MHFMNRSDIEEAVERHAGKPVLARATKFLKDFQEMIDDHSDGWPYWAPPVRSADKLMTLIEDYHPWKRDSRPICLPTEADLKKAITPIKSFCTRKKLPCPKLEKCCAS